MATDPTPRRTTMPHDDRQPRVRLDTYPDGTLAVLICVPGESAPYPIETCGKDGAEVYRRCDLHHRLTVAVGRRKVGRKRGAAGPAPAIESGGDEPAARKRFARGQRVRTNESGRRLCKGDGAGTIVGFGRDPNTVRVRLDGHTSARAFHHEFFDPE